MTTTNAKIERVARDIIAQRGPSPYGDPEDNQLLDFQDCAWYATEAVEHGLITDDEAVAVANRVAETMGFSK